MAAEIKETLHSFRVYGGTIAAPNVRQQITPKLLTVQKILWTLVSTVAHRAIITDKNGDTVATFVADAPGTSGVLMYTLDFPKGIVIDGPYVDKLDSGELFFFKIP